MKNLKPMSPAGEARLLQLQQWSAADRTEGDFRLTGALRKWRDDVIRRLCPSRPLRIRIPKLFLSALGLHDQKVVICEDGSVSEFLGRDASGFRRGQLIVDKFG